MPGDDREHLRLPIATRLFIELVSPGTDEADAGEIVTCKTLDVSRGGLQVQLDQELTVGAILHIGVQMPDEPDPLYLAGSVEWCIREDETGNQWSAGFRLMNAHGSDIDSWVSLLTEMTG